MMKLDYSYGCLVYKIEKNEYKYLLIKQRNGSHIGFPKGHKLSLESNIDAAKREVFEETNISVSIFENTHHTIKYYPTYDIEKEVTYYLAKAQNEDIKIDENEIIYAFWASKEEVNSLLTYENDKEAFQKITRNNHKRPLLDIVMSILFILSVLTLVTITDLSSSKYAVKALFKLIILLVIPGIYLRTKGSIKQAFTVSKKTLLLSIGGGILIYGVTLGGYFIVRNYIDFSTIPNTLEQTLGITKNNFIWVALYIPIVNAFIEEFFFRYFLINRLRKFLKQSYSVSISAIVFALYHVAIIGSWQDPLITVGAVIGLFIVGLLFGFISSKEKSIIPTYIIHGAANLAINTAACIILGVFL